jgi:hypothetical protein
MSSDQPRVRASDADRAAVADALRAHCAAGRLDVDELEQRLAAALAARTLGELDALVRDLPAKPVAAGPGQAGAPGRNRAGLPGVRSFRQQHELRVKRDRVFAEVRANIVPAMVAAGYDVVDAIEDEMLVFERDRNRVVVALSDSGETGTRLTVQGTASRAVRKAFANLRLDPA